MRDRILGAMLLVLLFIGSTEAFAADYGSNVYYLTAEQAVEYSLVDEILGSAQAQEDDS